MFLKVLKVSEPISSVSLVAEPFAYDSDIGVGVSCLFLQVVGYRFGKVAASGFLYRRDEQAREYCVASILSIFDNGSETSYIIVVMLDLRLFEKFLDSASDSDDDSVSSALKPFGLSGDDVLKVADLERKCRENRVIVLKSIERQVFRGAFEIVFSVVFKVFEDFAVRFEVHASALDEYLDNECAVTLNGISKYRGTNMGAAVDEVGSLVDEGIEKREGYRDSSDYKCSLFKIKYLSSFKALFEDKTIDKSKIEKLLKDMKCKGVFVTDAFVRSNYDCDGNAFSLDLYDDGKADVKASVSGRKCEFSSKDMSVCIRKLCDFFFGCSAET
ncbi:MAG TPA: hypothetical protein DCO86_03160 [Spirochaetaceae bacterium]|nr:hypothetical protein [Spirochaetaceae bacterium]